MDAAKQDGQSSKSSKLLSLSRNKSVKLAPDAGEKSLSRGMSRALSRKKSGKAADDNSEQPRVGRILSRKRSLCDKLARGKEEPQYGSRCKTGQKTLQAKRKVVEQYPELNIQYEGTKQWELVMQGVNAVKAETIDMNAMIVVMQDNVKMLSHAIVERFFEWIGLFGVFLERYLTVEEDFIMKWLDERDSLRGNLKTSARMMMRGRILRGFKEIEDIRDVFMPHLPAGERLPRLVEVVQAFTREVVEWIKSREKVVETIGGEGLEKIRLKIVKHVVGCVGYQDFLVMLTRWMRRGQVLEWRADTLFVCDFRFFSYAGWEKDMERAHFEVAGQFAELVEEEIRESEALNEESKVMFEREMERRQVMDVGAQMLDEEQDSEQSTDDVDK